MQAYTYVSKGKFELREKSKPVIMHERDAIVKVTLASICSSDLHIKHGSVPRAVLGITVGHEMVGIVEEVGGAVTHVKPGDRVTVNVETFCGECYFCKKGYVNNCTDQNGGWALGCRIDGGQAEYVRVPFADQGLNKIPDEVTERQALFVGDVLATGYWATRISEITEDDTVLIIGAGPTGICTLLCVMLKNPKHIIMCEKDEERIQFINKHYPDVLTVSPEECEKFVKKTSDHGGADVVLEVAGAESTFRLAWECARPNAIVTIVALYDKAQSLPLPSFFLALLLMYFLSLKIKLFPVIGSLSLKGLVMPVLTLALTLSAWYIRQVRAIIRKEMQGSYIDGLRARGMSERQILFGHVLRNCRGPLVTLIGISFGSMLGGTTIVESIFSWPGVGKLAVDAITARDYPVIQSYVVWMAVIYLSINYLIEFLYPLLDPRTGRRRQK